jgi:hypothetical protein
MFVHAFVAVKEKHVLIFKNVPSSFKTCLIGRTKYPGWGANWTIDWMRSSTG